MGLLPRRLAIATSLYLAAMVAWSASGAAEKSIHQVPPEACKQCHEVIYEQWMGSMHAESSALNDPIHAAFYQSVVGDPKQEGVTTKNGKYPVCLGCHAPIAAVEKKTKLDANPAFGRGVSCVSCHSFSGFKGLKDAEGKLLLGVSAYNIDSTHLYGPSGITYTTQRTPKDAEFPTPVYHPQPMQGNRSALYESNDVCMGCHDRRPNMQGVQLCQTGDEYSASKSSVSCQACHMPVVTVKDKDGKLVSVADHTMPGGHSDRMIARGLAMDMDTKREGDVIKTKVTLRNRLPHSYPTGAPFRNFYLKLTAYDKDGNSLWQNFQTHPLKDDPKAMFVYMLGDAGHPAPPPKATEVLFDTRLKPNEVRELDYEIPANDNIAIIRAEALYNLLLPDLVKNFGDKLPEEVKVPKLAASAEIRL